VKFEVDIKDQDMLNLLTQKVREAYSDVIARLTMAEYKQDTSGEEKHGRGYKMLRDVVDIQCASQRTIASAEATTQLLLTNQLPRIITPIVDQVLREPQIEVLIRSLINEKLSGLINASVDRLLAAKVDANVQTLVDDNVKA
jgi:hypothetical protein